MSSGEDQEPWEDAWSDQDTTQSKVEAALREMQRVLDEDGPRPLARVAADAAAIQVRKIVGRMIADEREGI